MALNEQEKARIRHFLGHPGISNTGAIHFGVPSKTEPAWILESNFENILESHEPTIRSILAQLECVEQQIGTARESLETNRVGDIHFRGREALDILWEERIRWTAMLSDAIGAPGSPFSDTLYRMGYGPGGVIEPQ